MGADEYLHDDFLPSFTADVEPWPEPVRAGEMLDEMSAAFSRHLSLPPGAADMMALWCVATHAIDLCEHAPRLLLKSPVRRCGKTSTLGMLTQMVRRPIAASNVSAATIYRLIESDRPCLVLDEADTYVSGGGDKRLVGVINSGHSRTSGFVFITIRGEPVRYSTFAPMILAGIGDQPATIEDRSLIVPMQRAAPDEPIERLRRPDLERLAEFARKADRWVRDNRTRLTDVDPELPHWLQDRAADNTRMLLAIADATGIVWSERARRSLKALMSVSGVSDVSPEETLLGDLRDFFAQHPATRRFTSQQIVHAMHELDRWTGLNAHTMARMLKPFGITPKVIRIATGTQRGYEKSMFADAFDRYAPKPETTETPEASQGDDAVVLDEGAIRVAQMYDRLLRAG